MDVILWAIFANTFLFSFFLPRDGWTDGNIVYVQYSALLPPYGNQSEMQLQVLNLKFL